MGAVSIHVTITIGDSPVTKQEGDLVCGLWPEAKEIPEHVSILDRMEHKNITLTVITHYRLCIYGQTISTEQCIQCTLALLVKQF